MTKYNQLNEQDLLDALLRLPVRNLESRIRLLEDQSTTRQQLSNEALSALATRQEQLQDQLHQLRYIQVFQPAFSARQNFQNQIMKLEEQKFTEIITCFRDLSLLAEKRLEAESELELDTQKLGLVSLDSLADNNSNDNFTN